MISLLGEVAFRMDDSSFKDFPQNVYERALLRANRIVAKKYEILQKVYSFTLDALTEDIDKDCLIELEDFDKEILVAVNEVSLNKGGLELTEDNQYFLRILDGQRYFNYRTAKKNLKDEIVIIYKILPTETDDRKTEFVIPDKYQEELIDEVLMYLSKIGMAKFQAEKKQKYITIYNTTRKLEKIDQSVVENTQFATIKPYQWWKT